MIYLYLDRDIDIRYTESAQKEYLLSNLQMVQSWGEGHYVVELTFKIIVTER